MLKKMKLSDCTEGPWKNGKGKTRQVAIYPHEATLAENNFDWRLSSATISGENSFSSFVGYDRWLIIWKGEGVLLNGEKLLPHTPFHFHGEEQIDCTLSGDEVVDLGLIYNRDYNQAHLSVLTKTSDLVNEKGTIFLFLAKGTGLVGKHQMDEGDFLILENRTVHLELPEGSLAYVFTVLNQ